MYGALRDSGLCGPIKDTVVYACSYLGVVKLR